jgi:DNA-binding MarR family transcriptional regulator
MSPARRSVRKQEDPDLETLSGRLLFGIHGELLARLSAAGFDGVRSRHAGVVAFLDDDGVRPGDVARLIGRSKQTTGATLDELERLGYLTREVDPADRRARLVVPTERGRALAAAFDEAVADIERRHRELLGDDAYAGFATALRRVVEAQHEFGPDAPTS